MPRATWSGAVLAESEDFEEVDGNVYFPPDAVDRSLLEASDHRTTCIWKGKASYYDVVVDGQRNPNAAWCYPEPKPRAARIKDHVAFWKGVTVER